MKIGAIIQARMNSQRFPGKVLYEVAGEPMLQYLLQRLNHCYGLSAVIVATSSEESDTPIVKYCMEQDVMFYRGSLNDVASRFKEILEINKFDGFIRISGDSPLLDQRLIERGVDIFLNGDFDMVTNILVRSFPKGQSIEVLKSAVFLDSYNKFNNEDEREHVTRYFYKNSSSFAIYNISSKINYSNIQLSVDTDQDMNIFKKIVSQMNKPHWHYTMDEILHMHKKLL
tara:strand:+ start:96 stop:779 length:684 start_codon:yes stop_codon:yes gene_type:complete